MCPLQIQSLLNLSTRRDMVGCTIKLKKRKPEWLNVLLRSKFFGSCADHHDLRKNEKNMFCVDCNIGFCKHCITSSTHSLHQWFQICKYVYQDVVRLQDIQIHLDCSKIQTYKINGEKAVHLNPRPPTKDTKIAKLKGGGTRCDACGRHIQDLPNSFCSIACKVSIVNHEMFKDLNHKNITIPTISEFDKKLCLKGNENEDPSSSSFILLDDSSEVIQAWWSSKLKPKKQLHKRKGVPHRAPLH